MTEMPDAIPESPILAEREQEGRREQIIPALPGPAAPQNPLAASEPSRSEQQSRQSPHTVQLAEASNGGHVYQALGDQTVYQRDMLRSGSVVLKELTVASSNLFVEPDGLGDAHKLLALYGLVVLVGEEGIGKRTAGLRLLIEFGHVSVAEQQGKLRLKELFADWEKPSVGDLPATPGHAYLLDLGTESTLLPEHFGRELGEHARKLQQSGSILVISVTSAAWETCAQLHLPYVMNLESPASFDVFERRLAEYTQDSERRDWGARPRVIEALSSRISPSNADILARKIADPKVANLRDLDLFLDEFLRWPDYIGKEFRKRQLLPHRTLLLSVAVMDGRSPRDIIATRRILLEKIGYTHNPKEILAEPDIQGQLDEIGAELYDGLAFITRTRPGLDQAVLRHVWIYYPDLHDALLQWVTELAEVMQDEAAVVGRLVDVLVYLIEEAHDFGFLDDLTRNAEAIPMRHKIASDVLERTARSRVVGQHSRDILLRWSKSKSLTNQLAVSRICRGKFADQFVSHAVTRVKWLLFSDYEAVQQDVSKTLRTLAVKTAPKHAILHTVIQWLGKNDAVSRTSGRRGFAALMSPDSDDGYLESVMRDLDQNDQLRDDLKSGWRMLLLDPRGRQMASDLLQQWAAIAGSRTLPMERGLSLIEDVVRRCVSEEMAVLQLLFEPKTITDDNAGLRIFHDFRERVFTDVFRKPAALDHAGPSDGSNRNIELHAETDGREPEVQ